MKSRKEIKALAKTNFKSRYWFCVGMSFLMSLIIGALSGTGIGSILLTGPLCIGLNFLWIGVFTGSNVDAGAPFSKAFEDFGRKLGGYWWMILHLFLWCLIPIAGIFIAIVKSFAYGQTLYLLADCPNVPAQDALSLSRRMMKGHKWQLFVFDLSFIGWWLLAVITCGLVGVFYLAPFQSTARAGWYLELREQCLREGVITADELNGTVPGAAAPAIEAPAAEAEQE